jgi:sugar PTS system EIIA component
MFGIFKKKEILQFNSPIVGKAIDICGVPDEVFASGMLGVGIAFEPSEGVVYSPCDGEIVQIFPTKHAVGIKSTEGIEILVHIGIDTVILKGEGFETLVNAGDLVKKGDKLITFDLETIRSRAKSILTPMIITNMDIVDNVENIYGNCGLNNVALKVKLK